jgi:hypothetical protein
MQIVLEIAIGIVAAAVLVILFEYRLRRPDYLVVHESGGQIQLRKGLFYPRHFSLLLKRSTCPIQSNIDASTRGNLGVRIRLVGSAGASMAHLQSLIRVGGWNQDAVIRATEEVQAVLQEWVKEYTESVEINTLASAQVLANLSDRREELQEKFGVELITLTIQSMDPIDPEIGEALRQQEQARLLEQTENLNQRARMTAARAKASADEEIANMEHALDLKKVELKKSLLEKESALSKDSLAQELERNRMRLEFEIEELEALKKNPELLMLTPQAARLAEASQSLKNARTVISLNPQENTNGPDLLKLFQEFLQKAIEKKKD